MGVTTLGWEAERRVSFGNWERRTLRSGLRLVRLFGCIRRRIDEHLARAIVAIGVVAVAGLHLGGPGREVLELFLRLLREEIVRDAQRHLAILVELFDDLVIFGIILEAAAWVWYNSVGIIAWVLRRQSKFFATSVATKAP